VATWDDTEVVRRWLLICPVWKNSAGDPEEPNEVELNSIRNDRRKLETVRLRLSDLGGWMRVLCQDIAVRPNPEDEELDKVSPAAGVMLDSMETRLITGQRRSSEELTYTSSATGSATETASGTDTFRSDTVQSTTTTGHVRITSNQETNPATSGSTSSDEIGSNTTGKTSSHEADVLIYGSTSSLQATNIGSEHFEYENGHLIRDDESDTTTQSIIYDRWQDETISNTAASLQNDPTTGLTTTASAISSSTDHLTSHTIVNLTNIHTASLTNPGSDSTSGTSITTGTKQSTHNASSTIHQTGTLPTGESIDLNNIVVLAAAVQTTFTSTGNLAADGTITSTDSSTTTINIPTIYAAQFGTVRTTAAETGVVTTCSATIILPL
jgi:hypothetical protein